MRNAKKMLTQGNSENFLEDLVLQEEKVEGVIEEVKNAVIIGRGGLGVLGFAGECFGKSVGVHFDSPILV